MTGSMTGKQVVWNEWMGCWYDLSSPALRMTYVTTAPFQVTTTATEITYTTARASYLVNSLDNAIPTPQERRETQVAMEAQRRASAAAMVVRDEADKKAHALLMSILTPTQRESYEKTARFELALTRKDGTVVRYTRRSF